MKKQLLYIVIFFCFMQQFYSQEDGVVAFALPVRNSLKFNKYAINPTFSFVREQNKYISFSNKREWVQFDDAPQTYLFSYSGRFAENAGAGIGLFQQNYGVLTTFGGVLNFAYNAVLDRDSNLTFGMNLGFYKSGINEGSVITNFPDPSLENIPSNSLITANPGINYGTTFFDFGVSINNLISYNLKTSKIIEDNPEQSIQAHIMYTGYVDSRGFFDESKFSGLLRSEFKKDKTVISGIMMLTIPKGMWAQAGYNSLYGVSGGIGFNISNQIAIEYNYEKAIGDLSTFGNSHEFTLAYKFKKNNRYNYSDNDKEGALITPVKNTRRSVAKRKGTGKSDAEFRANRIANAKAKAEKEAQSKVDEEAKLESAEDNQDKVDEEARIKLAQEEQARLAEEARIKLAQEEQARLAEEARLKAQLEEQARLAEAARIKGEQEEQARLAEEARLKAQLEEQARLAEAARFKAEQEAQSRVAAEKVSEISENNIDIPTPTDTNTDELSAITKLALERQNVQKQLMINLNEVLIVKEKDLKDLKEENDLSEQGIFSEPKPFKSVSAENAKLESLKNDLENEIKSQNDKIVELEALYSIRLKNVKDNRDETNMFYSKTIKTLKENQDKTIQAREAIFNKLESVKDATEIERKRRIKRAAYDNEQDRYLKDRTALNEIKANTLQSSVPLKEDDFDFGEEQTGNIQIVKGVKNIESGYYLVLAVHSDVEKRDDFLTKAVSLGRSDIDFFYDVTTSKYYIYYKKFDDIDEAMNAIKSNGNEPYNSKMSMVKIEN